VTADTPLLPGFSRTRGGTREIVLVQHDDRAALGDPGGRICRSASIDCVRARAKSQEPEPAPTDVMRGFVYTRGGALREIRPDRRAE
jgi:carbonic anhydrase